MQLYLYSSYWSSWLLQESHMHLTKGIISKVAVTERGNSKLKETDKSTAIDTERTLSTKQCIHSNIINRKCKSHAKYRCFGRGRLTLQFTLYIRVVTQYHQT
jgi:N6-adenosine-specific RNA methylase IME4